MPSRWQAVGKRDYIFGFVHSTSQLVFSLASFWWIREECFGKIPPVPLVLSGYCLYLPSIHPGSLLRNVFNNTSLKMQCLEWLVWFRISHFAIFWGNTAHITHAVQKTDGVFQSTNDALKNRSFKWLKRRITVITHEYYLTQRLHHHREDDLGSVSFELSLGHEWRLGAVVPKPCHRKWCHLTSFLHTSCLIRAAEVASSTHQEPQLWHPYLILFNLAMIMSWTRCKSESRASRGTGLPVSEVSSSDCMFLSWWQWGRNRHSGQPHWNNWGRPAKV